MWNNKQKNIWQDIKDTWKDQPESEKINIQISQLLNDFKINVSQLEKDSIKSDINTMNFHLDKFKKSNKINQFEKNLIKETSIKNNTGLFIGIGTSIGMSIGIAFGSVFDNIGIGISLGISFGGGIGFILWLIMQKINDKKD